MFTLTTLLLIACVTLSANDFSITHDPTYFNPLAVSFKWDIRFDKTELFNSEQSIQIRYQLYDTNKKKVVWQGKQQVDLKEKNFSLYLFITEINNHEEGPFIRIETIPSKKVTYFEVIGRRYSNAVLFKGKRKTKGDFTTPIKLVGTELLKSNNGKVDKDFFSIMHVPADTAEKKICNLNVDFFIVLDVLTKEAKKEN